MPIPSPASIPALGPANVVLLAAGASHLLATQAETGAVQAVPNPEASASVPLLPTIEEVSGCIDFGGRVRYDNAVGEFVVETGEVQAVPNPERTSAPTLRAALDKAKALVVHWTTFRDGFHSLDPMPQEAQERYPEWGWYRAKDVKAFVAEVEAALRVLPNSSTPALREALEHAARLLAKSLPDEVLESMREEWGHTNVAVIQHWRDAVLAALRASVPNPEATPAPALREALVRIAQIGRPHCQRVGEADEDDIRALCQIQEIAEAALRASEGQA